MGSFNSTGFISKIPITYGDKVVCIIATVNKNIGRELYYPDSMVSPWTFPIYGEYNDYGSIENVRRDFHVELLEKIFGKDIEKVCKGIERMIYGNNLDKCIEYWKNNKEITELYLPLKKLYDTVNLSWMGSESKDYQPYPVLLFEHADIYEKFAARGLQRNYGYSGEVLAESCRSYLNILNMQKELTTEIRKIKSFENFSVHRSRQMFCESYNRPYFSVFSVFESTIILKKIKKDVKEESEKKQIEFVLDKIDEYRNFVTNWRQFYCYSHEGMSRLMMSFFEHISLDDTIEFLEKEKKLYMDFCGMLQEMSYIPMHIEFSHTGSQECGLKEIQSLYEDCIVKIKEIQEKEY